MLAACGSGPTKRDKRLNRFMDELYFGGSYDSLKYQDHKLARWEGPMRVAVSGIDVEDHLPTIEAFLQDFSRITGLDISIVNGATEGNGAANVKLILEKESLFAINREFANCYVTMARAGTAIRQGTIHITANEPESFDRCLAHEFMHLVGIRYHSPIVTSVMSPAHKADTLTQWDDLALRVLFDPRLSPEQPREEVLALLSQIIAEQEAKDE